VNDEDKTLDQVYIDAGIYEPEPGSIDKTAVKAVDPQTQSASADKPIDDPEGVPDNQKTDQAKPDDKLKGPDGAGDKLVITDDSTYMVQNQDGSVEELSGKDLKGRMLLKSKYDSHLREHEETVAKPHRESIEFVEQLTAGLTADPVATTSNLISNIAQQYGVDYGNVINALLSEAHRRGDLQNIVLYDVDEGEDYVPVTPKNRPAEDPAFQQQLRNESNRAFQAEMRADRVEALNMPDLQKVASGGLSPEIIARADQLYQVYRSNVALSPIGKTGNQYHAALVTAWNESVMLGTVSSPPAGGPPAPSLINKQQSPKQKVTPTTVSSDDPDEALYRKWKILT